MDDFGINPTRNSRLYYREQASGVAVTSEKCPFDVTDMLPGSPDTQGSASISLVLATLDVLRFRLRPRAMAGPRHTESRRHGNAADDTRIR